MTPGPYETGKHTELAREPPCTTLPALFPKMSTETSLKYLLNFVSNILMFHSFCFSSPVPSLPQTLSEVWLIRPLPSLHIPLPRVQLVVPWMFSIKIYPCQEKKNKPCRLQFLTNPTSPNWCEASNLYTFNLSVNTGFGHHTVPFPCSCHWSLIL